MSNYIVGVTSYYHDSSVCFFIDGMLVFACEEERFTGIKHDNSFPVNSLNYLKNEYGLTRDSIDAVCYYEDPKLRLKRKKSFFKSLINNIKVWWNLRKISKKIHYTPHHISHMLYAYHSSEYTNSSVISIDGVGETETISIGKGVGNEVKQIKTTKYPHSLGLFYSAMTSFLGFKPNEGEYKVMGLAAYGGPNKYINKVRKLIKYDNGGVVSTMKYFTWDSSNKVMFSNKLPELLGVSNRLPHEELTQEYMDIAAAVQLHYEEIFFNIVRHSSIITDSNNICFGGGCAYNGLANGKLIDKFGYNLWVPLAPSDAGSSIGSCIDYMINNGIEFDRINTNPFLGPHYTIEFIENEISRYNLISHKLDDTNKLVKEIAKQIHNGKIVGWFSGRMEFGARALGNRSILANPTLPHIQDKINKVVKRREGFRPFAPMVTYNDQTKYFKSGKYIPYMNVVVDVKDEYRDKLPSITHKDGTARVQSVTKGRMYMLLKEFEKLSGYPVLLNTSFNIKDKTIVLTPKDAIETFLDTDMDILMIENHIIYKDEI